MRLVHSCHRIRNLRSFSQKPFILTESHVLRGDDGRVAYYCSNDSLHETAVLNRRSIAVFRNATCATRVSNLQAFIFPCTTPWTERSFNQVSAWVFNWTSACISVELNRAAVLCESFRGATRPKKGVRQMPNIFTDQDAASPGKYFSWVMSWMTADVSIRSLYWSDF